MKVDIGPYPKGNGRRKQRVKIHGYDVWNLDHTLALIIVPALKRIQSAKHGIPGCMIDHSYHEKFTYGTKEFIAAEKKAEADGQRKWHEYISAMIWSFSEVLNEDKNEPDISKNREAWNAYQSRKENGFKLFGEYYQCLWT